MRKNEKTASCFELSKEPLSYRKKYLKLKLRTSEKL